MTRPTHPLRPGFITTGLRLLTPPEFSMLGALSTGVPLAEIGWSSLIQHSIGEKLGVTSPGQMAAILGASETHQLSAAYPLVALNSQSIATARALATTGNTHEAAAMLGISDTAFRQRKGRAVRASSARNSCQLSYLYGCAALALRNQPLPPGGSVPVRAPSAARLPAGDQSVIMLHAMGIKATTVARRTGHTLRQTLAIIREGKRDLGAASTMMALRVLVHEDPTLRSEVFGALPKTYLAEKFFILPQQWAAIAVWLSYNYGLVELTYSFGLSMEALIQITRRTQEALGLTSLAELGVAAMLAEPSL